MPNIFVGQISASAPTNALIATTSSTAIVANNNRVGLTMVNISSSTMYLGLANNAAVLNAGIALVPNGGVWVMDEYTYDNGQVNAIAHTANSILAIQEFTR